MEHSYSTVNNFRARRDVVMSVVQALYLYVTTEMSRVCVLWKGTVTTIHIIQYNTKYLLDL